MLIPHTPQPERQAMLWSEQAPRPVKRASPSAVFLALYPDSSTTRRFARLAEYLRHNYFQNGQLIAPERHHITLIHVGNYIHVPHADWAIVADAVSALPTPTFQIAFDRVVDFGKGKKRPIVLVGEDGVAGVTQLQALLKDALGQTGVLRRQPPFNPHLTLLYERHKTARPEERWLDRQVEKIPWTAREFVLVESLRGQSIHVPLRRWAMRA